MSYTSNNISIKRGNDNISSFLSGKLDELEFRPYSNLFYPYIWDNGGSLKNISLTIDIVNKENVIKSGLPDEKWTNREDGEIKEKSSIWRFVETSHSQKHNKSVSNGFCFDGQSLTFYIAPKGQRVGHQDDTWFYSLTTVTVSVLNLVTGTEQTLKTFNNFEATATDTDRFFTWSVPIKNDEFFNTYGQFGIHVIKLNVQHQYFEDAELLKPTQINLPSEQSHFLHLLTFSGAKELIDVTNGGIDILDESISEDYALEDIFEKTILETLEDDNISLSDSQKRAIIADQVAVLFASQHPVITADYFPSKILGYGIEAGQRIETAVSNLLAQHPDVLNLSQNRLYSMLANYQRFNYAIEIEDLFSDHSQSNQIISDPVRTIYMNESGIIDDKLGVDGINFNPYVVESLNTEGTLNVLEQIKEIQLFTNNVEIDNILIKSINNNSLTSGETDINISFRVLSGNEFIEQIRYTLWTKNSLNKFEYLDENGTSRSTTINMSGFGGIEYLLGSSSSEDIESADEGDVVIARIDILDTFGKTSTFSAEEFLPDEDNAPGITNIVAFQRQDGSNMADIWYTYYGFSDINSAFVSLSYSEDEISWTEINDDLYGDVGGGITPGYRNIVWNFNRTFSGTTVPESVFVKITLIDADGNVNVGAKSRCMTLHAIGPEVAVRRVTIEEDAEQFETSSSSDSESSSSSSSEGYSDSSSSSSSSVDSSSSSSSSEGYSESSSSSSQ
tara:strand:- start:8359 stop:10551 length:2193 start_codon:yes stop_codon:yes gene_type:complete